ncbi:hypothetical protein SELMODRAFT_431745 [Selaginella moellendorffii]|uniref:Uncharacterized protein n=1 Tax=Selaginella moellendorffii TaxID=88036 RepID=D8TDM9_SELML|nr:hypothetical protein SELMODRAFT_431745 [Selaginella moellendorffii]
MKEVAFILTNINTFKLSPSTSEDGGNDPAAILECEKPDQGGASRIDVGMDIFAVSSSSPERKMTSHVFLDQMSEVIYGKVSLLIPGSEPSSLDYHTLSWVTSWFQPTVLVATPEAYKFVLSKDSFETGWPKSAVVLIGRNLFAGLTEESYLKLQKLTESTVNNPNALKHQVTASGILRAASEECLGNEKL